MSKQRQKLGRWGEDLAARHLQAANYRIVERNYRCPAGEMDLIASYQAEWGFVEVKPRRGDSYGRPEDAITKSKAGRLVQVAETYLQEHQLSDVDWRIDVIAIELDSKGKFLRLEQIENAVNNW